jgi:hypothetical protein
MQNAHERFGTLEVTKCMKDTTTRVRVYIDRVVLEPAQDEQGQSSAHFISMSGKDSSEVLQVATKTFDQLFPGNQGMLSEYLRVHGMNIPRNYLGLV